MDLIGRSQSSLHMYEQYKNDLCQSSSHSMQLRKPAQPVKG